MTICLSGAAAVSFSSFLVALEESLLTGLESLLLDDEDVALDEEAFEAVAAAFLRAGMMEVRPVKLTEVQELSPGSPV